MPDKRQRQVILSKLSFLRVSSNEQFRRMRMSIAKGDMRTPQRVQDNVLFGSLMTPLTVPLETRLGKAKMSGETNTTMN